MKKTAFIYVAWFHAPGESRWSVSAHGTIALASQAAANAADNWETENPGTGVAEFGYDHVPIDVSSLQIMMLQIATDTQAIE